MSYADFLNDGNVGPYLAILDAHLPLPTTSLNEP